MNAEIFEDVQETAIDQPQRSGSQLKRFVLGLPSRPGTMFLTALLFILAVCFVDSFTSTRLVPTYIKHILVSCLIYSLLTLALNFVSGYIGQTSLGHAAFFGIGAYITTLLTKYTPVNFWISIPIAMAIAALVSIPLAMVSQRVKGSFLVVITYGFGEVLRYVVINTPSLGASAGIPGVPAPLFFGTKFGRIGPSGKEAYILLAFGIVALTAFFMHRIAKSRTNYAFSAIREDEIAAVAMGINTKYYKMAAFMLSAVLSSVAGSLQATYAAFVSPEMLSSTQSILILTMVIVGGARSIKGAILGAFVMTILPELFQMVKDVLGLPFDPWMILYGLILITMMRLRPQGIWGKGAGQ
ncbi:branched-chain amino acid ABC transporter permease [Oscillospiraceae bacterium MB08-C2-2]|nr:branched-chain amino acid ABC transporter permease [Oscillospiraceae bacterium MB08-C2-2]